MGARHYAIGICLRTLAAWLYCRHSQGWIFDRVGDRTVLRCPRCFRDREIHL